MKSLTKENCVLEYSANNPPALKIASGETFQLETPSILTHPELLPDKTTVPVTGPIFLEHAVQGDVLKVDILKIQLTAGEGAIVAKPGKGAFGDRIIEPTVKVVPYDDKYAYFSEKIKVPLRPMVGKIGVAPLGVSIDSHIPGAHGGNMDITDINEGSSVYLPIFVDGALLACGDVHAVMGDGESEFSALETEASLTLRCQVVKGMELTQPMVVSTGKIMTVGQGRTLEEACNIALDDMVELITSKLGLEFIDAVMLISIAADLKINQIVNTLVGVRLALSLSLLPLGNL